MSLLNWLGLLWLLVVPALVVLYMFRPNRLRKPVSSLRLWQALPQMERSRARLRRPPLSLLLILQALALAVGAFALSQPALTAPASRHTILVLDASGSMQALDKGVSRFEEAKAEAEKIAASLNERDRLTLLRAGVNVTTACSNCTRADAERALAEMLPGAGTADIEGALAVAGGLARQSSGGLNAVVISDGEFAAPDLAGLDFGVRYIQVGSPISDVAVATLSARRPPDGRAGYIAYARIENRGDSQAVIQVSAQADTVPLPMRYQTVPQGGHVGLTWQVPAGTVRFTVSITPSDAMPGDDRAVIFLPASGQFFVNVAALQPEPYLRALGTIDGLNVLTNSLQAGAAFSIIEGGLPDPLPGGNLLLVNPDGALLRASGRVADLRPTVVDAAHALLAGLDLNALLVTEAGKYDPPDWLETLVDSPKGPLLLAGEQDGRRIAVLTFSPVRSNLTKLAAFPLLIANAVEWLYPLAGTQTVAPGMPLHLPAGSTVQIPSGRNIVVGESGLFSSTDEQGIYRVIDTSGGSQLQFAVNMADNVEAGSTDHPELNRPVEIAAGQVTSQVFWLPLAALALALFSGEWLIYCWRRGSL